MQLRAIFVQLVDEICMNKNHSPLIRNSQFLRCLWDFCTVKNHQTKCAIELVYWRKKYTRITDFFTEHVKWILGWNWKKKQQKWTNSNECFESIYYLCTENFDFNWNVITWFRLFNTHNQCLLPFFEKNHLFPRCLQATLTQNNFYSQCFLKMI